MVPIGTRGNVAGNDTIAQDRLVVVEHRPGIVEQQLDQALCQASALFSQDSLAPDEVTIAPGRLVDLHGKTQPGFQHMIVTADVVAEMPVCLLDAAGIHRQHPGHCAAEFLQPPFNRREDVPRHVGRDINLPAQFSDIADAVEPHRGHAELGGPHRAKRKRGIRQIDGNDRRKQLACAGAGDGETRLAAGHIDGRTIGIFRNSRLNQAMSRVTAAADVTIRNSVSESRATVRSASIPPRAFSHCV